MKQELYVKDIHDGETEPHFIGLFESLEAVSAYLSVIYKIVSVNENQHLLLLNEFSKDGKEIKSQYFIGCFETRDAVQKLMNDSHVIKEHED